MIVLDLPSWLNILDNRLSLLILKRPVSERVLLLALVTTSMLPSNFPGIAPSHLPAVPETNLFQLLDREHLQASFLGHSEVQLMHARQDPVQSLVNPIWNHHGISEMIRSRPFIVDRMTFIFDHILLGIIDVDTLI